MKNLLLYIILLFVSFNSLAVDNKNKDQARQLSGISIIGNKEAPKSLYIVPWKNSEVGVETSLTSGLLDKSIEVLDRDVFLRELKYYKLSH